MDTTVILVRHAEAIGNIKRLFHGSTDTPLTETGYAQLDVLAKRFETIPYDCIYSSDLHRAKETARAVNRSLKLPILIEPDIREIDGGDWEDKPFEDLGKLFPDIHYKWENKPYLAQLPNGESVVQVRDRVWNKILEIVEANKGKTICMVSHGTAMRLARCMMHRLPLTELNQIGWCDNTGITICRFDEELIPTILVESDNSHLLEAGLSNMTKQEWYLKDLELRRKKGMTKPCD
jgi:broad specificity phosphatase PhoE